jgi:hypothetical protein
MPLRDHFHPPFTDRDSWDVIHGGLPMKIAAYLNRVLPERYKAGPLNHIVASGFEVNIGTYELDTDDLNEKNLLPSGGSLAVATVSETTLWMATQPTLTVPADWSTVESFEVRVYDERRQRELVAVIELVSPSNKHGPTSRRNFVNKCAGFLQAGVSVAIIDFVTERHANLYAELMESIGRADPSLPTPPHGIYAVSLRARAAKRGQAVDVWYHPLAIGQPLPQLPVWLAERLAVPLDLEPIYEETLRDLRIR